MLEKKNLPLSFFKVMLRNHVFYLKNFFQLRFQQLCLQDYN